MSVGTPYCQKYSLWFLLLEEAFVQALEALSMTSLILCHFMNSVVDSIEVQLFRTLCNAHLVGIGARFCSHSFLKVGLCVPNHITNSSANFAACSASSQA